MRGAGASGKYLGGCPSSGVIGGNIIGIAMGGADLKPGGGL